MAIMYSKSELRCVPQEKKLSLFILWIRASYPQCVGAVESKKCTLIYGVIRAIPAGYNDIIPHGNSEAGIK